jgi:hypothetical protein
VAILRIIGINIALCLAVLLTGIAVTEIAIDRRLDIRTAVGPIYDRPTPGPQGAVRRQVSNGREITYVFDQLGARARATQVDYGKARTIAMVGDSFCFGFENDYDETLQAMLDRRFGESANIVNFCVTGSSSIYYPYTVATFRQRFPHPLDVLLLSLYPDMQVGDLPRVLTAQQNRASAERVASERQERARRMASSTLARKMFEIEVLLRRDSSTFNLLFPPWAAHDLAVNLRSTLAPEMFPELRGQLLSNLEALAAAADVPPERTVVWLVASKQETKALRKERESYFGFERPNFFRLSEQFWDETAGVLRGLGYTVVDPRPEITSALLDHGVAVYTKNGHYTRAAYEITARAVVLAIENLTHRPLSVERDH